MGKIELDHTGSGGGVTLSSDGTDLLLDGTAIGGTALELYAENPSSPIAPSATGTNAVAIGSDGIASGVNAIALGESLASGADSFAAANVNNTTASGATGGNSISVGYRAKASGTRSIAIGYFSNATATGAIGIGGSGFGADATSAYAIAIGEATDCSSGGGVAIGYNSDISSGANSSVALGVDNQNNSVAGKITFGANDTPGSGLPAGGPKTGIQSVVAYTTDATATVMTTPNSSGQATVGSSKIPSLPNNSVMGFTGVIAAREQASSGTDCAAWKIEGLIRREGSAGTTVLVNSATTVLDNTPSWGLALSADTTNGGLKIEATGAASTNIRWVATIHTSEVTY